MMEKMQQWVFIDLENIHNPSSLLTEQITMLFVFVGPMQPRIETEFIKKCELLKLKPRWIFIESVARNNVDSHLMYYLGRCDTLAGENIEFIIVSRDTDYDGLIEHVSSTGRKCKRIATAREDYRPSPPAPIPAAAPKPTEDYGKIPQPEGVLSPADGEIETERLVLRAVERLKRSGLRNRPSKANKLLNFLNTLHPKTLTPQAFLQEMLNRTFIQLDEHNNVTYLF